MEAITGRRVLYFGEINRLVVAENIVTAYRSRAKHQNWHEWSVGNPGLARLLADVEMNME